MRLSSCWILVTVALNATFGQLSLDVDTVTVTATRTPMKGPQTGRHITIITEDHLKSIAATSIDEILQTVTGLEVQSRGGFGTQADINIRASTFNQVLVLLDGMKINDPLTGHFNGNIAVTPGEISRIEILRGPATAIYGADAVGGVVNIITKVFSEKDVQNHVGGELNYGEHNLINAQSSGILRSGNTMIGAGFSLNSSDGEKIPARTIQDTELEAFNTFFDIVNAGISIRHDLGKSRLKARTSYQFADFNARYFYTTSPFDKSIERLNQWYTHLRFDTKINKADLDVNVAYKYNTDRFTFSPDFPSTNEHTTKFVNVVANYHCPISSTLRLISGVQLDRRSIVSNDRGDHSNIHVGAYGTFLYASKAFNATVSLRADYDDNYDFQISPQFNLAYSFSKLVLRGAVGKSIRAADYTERFVSNNLENLTPGRSLGNPSLMAEESWTEEIGFDYNISSNLRLKSTFFVRQSSELIDYILTNENDIGAVSSIGSLQANEDYFFAQNISSINSSGIETEIHFLKRFSNANYVNIHLGYSYFNTSDDQASVYISNHARHLFNSAVYLQVHPVRISLNGLYKKRNGRLAAGIGSELEDAYFVIHGKVSWFLNKYLSVNAQLQNITDESYQNILGAPMPSRWFLAGISFAL